MLSPPPQHSPSPFSCVSHGPTSLYGDDLCPTGLTHLHPPVSDTAQQMLNRREGWTGDRQGNGLKLSSLSPQILAQGLEHSTLLAWRLNCQAHLPDLSRF